MAEPNEIAGRKLAGATQAVFTAAGIASAFGAAACCGLPLLLASTGVGTAWLGSVALVAYPYRIALLSLAAGSLIAGAALLWREQRHAQSCSPGKPCASTSSRLLPLAGLVAGFLLLWLRYSYA